MKSRTMNQKRFETPSKFSLMKALPFRFAHAVFLVSLAVPAAAEWRSLGDVTASKPQGNQLTFAVGEASEGWRYEEERHIVWTRVGDTGAALTVKIAR